MNIEEIGVNTRNWVDSAQDRDYMRAVANPALNFRGSWVIEFIRLSIFFVTSAASEELLVEYVPYSLLSLQNLFPLQFLKYLVGSY